MKTYFKEIFSSEVTDKITQDFIDTGKIKQKYLKSIAVKMKEGQTLNQNEYLIFSNSVAEINSILRKI